MHKFIGTEAIIKALLDNGAHPNEKKTFEARYNLVMDAIYGDGAEEYYIHAKKGRPKLSTGDGLTYDLVLVEMYEYAQTQPPMTNKDLAALFVHRVEFIGTPRNATKRLADQYSQRQDKLHDAGWRKGVREIAKAQEENWGYSGHMSDQITEIKAFLGDHGWSF